MRRHGGRTSAWCATRERACSPETADAAVPVDLSDWRSRALGGMASSQKSLVRGPLRNLPILVRIHRNQNLLFAFRWTERLLRHRDLTDGKPACYAVVAAYLTRSKSDHGKRYSAVQSMVGKPAARIPGVAPGARPRRGVVGSSEGIGGPPFAYEDGVAVAGIRHPRRSGASARRRPARGDPAEALSWPGGDRAARNSFDSPRGRVVTSAPFRNAAQVTSDRRGRDR